MIAQYVNYLTTLKGYSYNTAKAYGKDLHDFARWAKNNLTGARWSTITRTDIDRYITYCVAAGLKPATTNRRLSAIAGIYGFFQREGKEVENPCQYESRRKIGNKVPNTIAKEDLQQAYEHSAGAVKIILGLLMTTGMRIQELLDLQWQDIDFKSCAIRVNGKGNKQRIVYSTPQALQTLQIANQYNRPTDLIFSLTQRETRRMVWETLKPYCKARQLSPHAIRHTFATNMAAHGVNCSTLAQMLGHNDLNTTQHYIDLGQMQAQRACQEYTLLG